MTERIRFLHATATRVIEPEVRRAAPEAQTASTEPAMPQKQGADY